MREKNVSIELLRVVCCVFVVAIHVLTDYRIQNEISWKVVFLESFVRCCVPVFFMLMGFFMFRRDKSIEDTWKKIWKQFIMPVLLITLFQSIFHDVIYNLKSVPDALRAYSIVDLGIWFRSLLRFEFSEPNFHLWYIQAAVSIYILYPLLKVICVNNNKANRVRRYIAFLLFLCWFVEPSVRGIFPEIADIICIPFTLQGYWFLYLIIGYELAIRKKCDKINWRGGMLYVFGSVLTFFFSVLEYFVEKNLDFSFFEYQTIGVFLSAIGLFIFFDSISIHGDKLKKLIIKIGSETYLIYLIHAIFIVVYYEYGIRDAWEAVLPRLVFYPAYILFCFASALCAAVILQKIQYLLKKVGKKIGEKKSM